MCAHRVNTIYNNSSQPENSGGIIGRTMPPKRPPLSAPEFGKWLVSQRRKRSHECIARLVRPLVEHAGLKVNRSQIVKFEEGRIPQWPMLYAFAVVYKETPAAIASRLFSAIEVDNQLLISRTSTPGSFSDPGGAVDVSDQARRIQEMEEQVAMYETRLSDVQDLASKLVGIVGGVDRETGASKKPSPRRRRSH